MTVGYARVSTQEQFLENQIHLLKEFGCEKVYTDMAGGAGEDRTGLKEMTPYLRAGDMVVVHKIDRIFRSLKNLVNLIDYFIRHQIQFKSLSEPEFDTTSSNGRFLLQIFGAVAEFERSLISERTRLGVTNARKRKKLPGRPKGAKKETVEKFHYAQHLYEAKSIPIDKACRMAGVSKTGFYRIDRDIQGINQYDNKIQVIYSIAMPGLTFLKDSEIESFDFPPRFTAKERDRFSVLPDNEVKFRKNRKDFQSCTFEPQIDHHDEIIVKISYE